MERHMRLRATEIKVVSQESLGKQDGEKPITAYVLIDERGRTRYPKGMADYGAPWSYYDGDVQSLPKTREEAWALIADDIELYLIPSETTIYRYLFIYIDGNKSDAIYSLIAPDELLLMNEWYVITDIDRTLHGIAENQIRRFIVEKV